MLNSEAKLKKIIVGFGLPRPWYALRLVKRIGEAETCCNAVIGYKDYFVSVWLFGVFIKYYYDPRGKTRYTY